MNRNADRPSSDLRNYFCPRPTIKQVLGIIFLLLALFGMMYGICSHAGPSMGFRPLPMKERLILAGMFPAAAVIMGLIQLVRSIHFMKSMEKRWPTAEEKERLNTDFAEAATVFRGAVKIGREYTFMSMELRIVETKSILSFHSETRSVAKGHWTYIVATIRNPKAATHPEEIPVFVLGANKKGKEDADDLIHEAMSVLDSGKL